MKLKNSLIGLLVACAGHAQADVLQDFLNSTHSLQAHFSQVVAGATNAKVKAPRRSEGELVLLRPGRFRLTYETPATQTIVANGKTVLIYDPALAQASQTPEAKALAGMPLAWLMGIKDSSDLLNQFVVENLPAQEPGWQWVRLTPKTPEASFKEARIGFEGAVWKALELDDALGQHVSWRLSAVRTNLQVPESTFELKLPQGVDIVKP